MVAPLASPDDRSHITAALRAWASALGDLNVRIDDATRAQVETTTFATTQTVVGLLRPANRDEVQECLRIANRFGVPLYPISRGRNWGLGSRVPVRSGCAVLDLSRLDRIIEFNEDYGYLTVEPGVTFAKAFELLTARGSRRMAN